MFFWNSPAFSMNGVMKSITGISRKVKHLQMKPVDFILIILLMIASFSPFLLLRGNQQPGQIAQLRVNSQVVKSFDLGKDQTYTYRDAAHDDINKIEVRDRKSTRLNSSHHSISYAVFC